MRVDLVDQEVLLPPARPIRHPQPLPLQPALVWSDDGDLTWMPKPGSQGHVLKVWL